MALVRPRTMMWVALPFTLTLLYLWMIPAISAPQSFSLAESVQAWRTSHDENYFWRTLVAHYPPKAIRPLPTGTPVKFPRVQKKFSAESAHAQAEREERRQAVKDTFIKSWTSYRERAWTADELAPVSGGARNPFGGWAATLVDSLDTLWIMGLREEFDQAVQAASTIDFTNATLKEINIFETNIRYLGGFLSAFDLSGDVRLLRKAVEVGEMIYKAFDTPNRMPITRWDIHAAMAGKKQKASTSVLVAEIGSLSMELTRLSLLTGDAKWFDASERITDLLAAQQDSTSLPGLWPLVVNAQGETFNKGSHFTLGAMADSLYEYLPKMSALTGGQLPIYQKMYEKAVATAVENNLFRPMTPTNEDILISGSVEVKDSPQQQEEGKQSPPVVELNPQGQHLVCFLGGLFALGGKLFNRANDISVATKLVDGCIWTYKALPHSIMPETFTMLPCSKTEPTCDWDQEAWKSHIVGTDDHTSPDQVIAQDRLPQGFTSIPDRRYILRPEAIESVFILYRITGRADLLQSAWTMFQAINKTTSTNLANSAVWDITVPPDEKPEPSDSMESFWFGETLKYFYLIFSEPTLISLDEYVFNTEAHPFRRLMK